MNKYDGPSSFHFVSFHWKKMFVIYSGKIAKNMEKVIASYMKEAINSDRTTIYNAIKDAGHPELAELIRRL